ncbi:cytidylyltransferase domain-containing protein [Anaeroarcus burkinensis]|uniref:cytidylyltransferase domain-containing protein n=1 Tax=Anaeroarcus burkinensis TaxID=82376 RepID=UPI0003F86C75|nr:glycosyltransferase family protein [Anaeroarcus burkinensis]
MIIAILQARMSSSRLPGKVLKEVCGKPMLVHQIERLKRARCLDHIVLATSDDASDDQVAATGLAAGVTVFRGNLEDVLDRFFQATKLFPEAKHIVRVTGDCPLLDPQVLEEIVEMHLAGSFSYTSNTLEPTFPDGLDVEVMAKDVLQQAWENASSPTEREHVTYYIYSHPEQFKLGCFKGNEDWSGLRWTVDEERDFSFVQAIYTELYPQYGNDFSWQRVLTLLKEKPELQQMNQGILRNEGLEKSLQGE